MSPAWIAIGVGLLGVIAAIVVWAQGRGRPPDLGFVSHQWLTEHRLSQTQDPQR
jgi:hypothetical protein